MVSRVSGRREEWLAERRELITASDAAAILGEDPRRGALAVYLEKVEGIEPEENVLMRRGRRHEAAIADEYGDQTGRPVSAFPDFTIVRHPSIPWLAFTPDRIIEPTELAPAPPGCAGPAPLQIKLGLGSARSWHDEAPVYYRVQVQIEIACYGASWGALAGLVGPGPLHVTDEPRHDAFLDGALPLLEEFRDRVRRHDPPEADGLEGTTEAIKRLWGRVGNGKTEALDLYALRLVEELDAAKAREQEAGREVQALKNRLRARLGPATHGALPDGSFLSLEERSRRAFEVEAAQFRVLRRWWPKRRLRRR
jgi:putative phage-type endonuclease